MKLDQFPKPILGDPELFGPVFQLPRFVDIDPILIGLTAVF
jgi:hypothetical protein